jgi:hypothetical protein
MGRNQPPAVCLPTINGLVSTGKSELETIHFPREIWGFPVSIFQKTNPLKPTKKGFS